MIFLGRIVKGASASKGANGKGLVLSNPFFLMCWMNERVEYVLSTFPQSPRTLFPMSLTKLPRILPFQRLPLHLYASVYFQWLHENSITKCAFYKVLLDTGPAFEGGLAGIGFTREPLGPVGLRKGEETGTGCFIVPRCIAWGFDGDEGFLGLLNLLFRDAYQRIHYYSLRKGYL